MKESINCKHIFTYSYIRANEDEFPKYDFPIWIAYRWCYKCCLTQILVPKLNNFNSGGTYWKEDKILPLKLQLLHLIN